MFHLFTFLLHFVPLQGDKGDQGKTGFPVYHIDKSAFITKMLTVLSSDILWWVRLANNDMLPIINPLRPEC